MSSARRGSIIGATWLIGLGVVFIAQQAMDLPWGQAWPLFVILVGVASFVSTALTFRGGGVPGLWSFTWSIVWIAVGVVLLLSTTGRLGTGPGELIAEYWPWLLVALGVWFLLGALVPGGPGLVESLSIPLAGTPAAAVRVRFGAGTLNARPAASGQLVEGTFRGGVVQRAEGPGRVELSQDTSYGLPWLDRESNWDLGLTTEVPLDLRLEAGASRTILDLRETQVRNLELQTGASETRVILPRAAGVTSVKAEAGAASLTFEIPSGVAARIRTRMALGSSQVDESRFPRVGDVYQSMDYGAAANRVDMDLQGGVGSLRIVGGA
jgi:hypothetical protein